MTQKNCAKCNAQNAPEMIFCTNCGAALPESGFSGSSTAALPPTMLGGSFPAQTAPAFSAPPKNSNASKILLAAAGGALALLLAAGVVGAGIFFYVFSQSPTPTDVTDGNSKPLVDRNPRLPANQNSNVAPNNPTSALEAFVRPQIGVYKVINVETEEPNEAVFTGALEEKQYKYANPKGIFSIHYTVARYASEADAQKGLREMMAAFNRNGMKTSKIDAVSDNNGTVVGIYSEMSGKNGMLSKFWTQHEFFIRIIGQKKDVAAFFAAH